MKSFPAKLLLFGEHTVNLGSQALALPLPLFSGGWEMRPELDAHALAKRQISLPAFAAYLENLQDKGQLLLGLDLPRFKKALAEGLVFESNIPTGYGTGSSGALTAAVLSEFGRPKNAASIQTPDALLRLRQGLAQMEAFFHGTSSGTDPLICYLQKPVLLGGPEGVKVVSLPLIPESSPIFLLDTGIERKATPLIAHFLEKSKAPAFRAACEARLLPAVEGAISTFLSGDFGQLYGHWGRISEFQFEFMGRMIPPAFRDVWQKGLAGGAFKLKICGAGGGGFMLGFARDWAVVREELAGQKVLTLGAEPC